MTKDPFTDEPFFEQFTGPIDLSDGKPLSIAPLQKPAALVLSGEILFILPEAETPARELQDYKIVSLGGLARRMGDIEAQHEEFDADFDRESYLDLVLLIDRAFEDEYELPKGVMIIRHGERAIIGRNITPELDLPEDVSRVHVEIKNSDEGITIADADSSNGTFIFLSPEDANQELPRAPIERYIADELRDELHTVFIELCDDEGDISYIDKDGCLIVAGGQIEIGDNGEMGIELYIRKALNSPDLNPLDGYEWRKLYFDRFESGALVSDHPLHNAGKPSISKLPRQTQMTEVQAQQALAMASFIKSKQ